MISKLNECTKQRKLIWFLHFFIGFKQVLAIQISIQILFCWSSIIDLIFDAGLTKELRVNQLSICRFPKIYE